MSEMLRKRHLSENNLIETVKHKKIDQEAKENISPEQYESINCDTYDSVCLQDTKMEVTTPKKNHEHLKELPITPSTNFKLFASLAADLDYIKCGTQNNDETFESQMSYDSDMSELSTGKINRKEKSLGIICTRFLAMYPLYPPPDKRIIVSLDEACIKLGVERRRLYDIVNVFESIDILTKNAKNQYLWFGKNNLLKSLYKLKDAAIQENLLEKLQYVLKKESNSCRSSCIIKDVKDFNESLESTDSVQISPLLSPPEMRKEKSLGIMSQKFLMLFLVSTDKVISLGVAAKVLNSFLQRNEKGAQIKTQIRRLYDIANVLSSIGLIQKENAFSPCGRKPAFKYIGPDLKDHKGNSYTNIIPSTSKSPKTRSIARHSSFQEICAVAEIEHQKLNSQESHNSAPPFDSSLCDEKDKFKTSFENLHLNSETNNKIIVNQTKAKIPVLLKQPLKIVNVRNPTANNSTGPYIIVNNMAEKSNIKCNNSSYGTQTFFLINTLAPSKEVKKEAVGQQSVNKITTVSCQDASSIKTTVKSSSPQTIKITDEQRNTILQSLNISLSSEQIAAIHLDGASQSNCSDASCNVIKIFDKTSSRSSENRNIIRLQSQKEIELNNGSTSVNNTRSNTPSSIQMVDSPISIPSGYVTPVPTNTADMSFPSNVEVNDILKKIESQTNQEISSNKVIISKENSNLYQETVTNPGVELVHPYPNIHTSEKLVNSNGSSFFSISKAPLISNDSCSSDSVNLEISNIFKGKSLGDTSVKSKPFLIDEKTLLSPIKTSNVTAQVSVPSNLITPPYVTTETVFFFNTSPAIYQNATINNNCSNVSKLVTFVPNTLTENRKGN